MGEHHELLEAVGETDGFVTYARGVIASATDLDGALDLLVRARQQSVRLGHRHTTALIDVVRAAVLVGLDRHAEAADVCDDLLDTLPRAGAWAEVGAAMHLSAELLTVHDEVPTAAVLLAAAAIDRATPPFLTPDRVTATRARVAAALTAGELDAANAHGIGLGRAAAAAYAREALARHRVRSRW